MVAGLPETPPPGGFIGTSAKYRCPVGVWLMPDNRQEGKLETMLAMLVPAGDPLFAPAETSSDRALQLGARFSASDRIKAVVHSWLAWQETPGLRLGPALRARFFRHDSPAALEFVAWFRQLFDVVPETSGAAGPGAGV